ncbi:MULTISPECIES: pseudouridine synthase [Candidatus Ichthyocystis]|uniref:pseudouridine synthase n=1 Tax=Candidatus Ichthyocystis TaxID=2929841 RepID=UPI000B12EC80|nr:MULTISPECIES: pseudouridine synthase [Ichthyocystis]
MIYRQKRRVNYSSRAQKSTTNSNSIANSNSSDPAHDGADYSDNYRPDVMTLHTLGVSPNSSSASRGYNASTFFRPDRSDMRQSGNNFNQTRRSSAGYSSGNNYGGGRDRLNTSSGYPYRSSDGSQPGNNLRGSGNYRNRDRTDVRTQRFVRSGNSSDSFPKRDSRSCELPVVDNNNNGRRQRHRRNDLVSSSGRDFCRSYVRRDRRENSGQFSDLPTSDDLSVDANCNGNSYYTRKENVVSENQGFRRRSPYRCYSNANKCANNKSSRISLLPSADTPQRLHKILANAGVGSRRDMEQLIIDGSVNVNGCVAEIGQKIFPTDMVSINGEIIKVDHAVAMPKLLLYYKPEGQIVSRDDPESRPTVFDNLPVLEEGVWIPIGRLDFNTSGLILFTTSGDLANHLMHPRYEIEREYAVRINCILTEDQVQSLLKGVELSDGLARFRTVIDVHPQHSGHHDSGEPESGDSEVVQRGSYNHWYRVILSEGRNCEVRRMFEFFGITVTRLIRVRYGDLWLPTDLKRGQCRELPSSDVESFLTRLEKRLNYYFDRKKSGRSPVHRRRWLVRRRDSSS